jgi:cell division protein FtsB
MTASELKAENRRLHESVNKLAQKLEASRKDNAELRAEVARLRKHLNPKPSSRE